MRLVAIINSSTVYVLTSLCVCVCIAMNEI